jgi:hypothetical protein
MLEMLCLSWCLRGPALLGGRLRRKGGIGLRAFALVVVPAGGFDGTRRRRDLACEYVPELAVLFVFESYCSRPVRWNTQLSNRGPGTYQCRDSA